MLYNDFDLYYLVSILNWAKGIYIKQQYIDFGRPNKYSNGTNDPCCVKQAKVSSFARNSSADN